jgi:hypothetical protein
MEGGYFLGQVLGAERILLYASRAFDSCLVPWNGIKKSILKAHAFDTAL